MTPIRSAVGCFALILFSFTLVMAQLPAVNEGKTVPNLIKFSGTIKDAGGIPRVGSLETRFALYADKEGGDAL
jgi:hypothetical protein